MPNGDADKVTEKLIVINSAGIHLRPAQMLARMASSYSDCEVFAIKEGNRYNAKSIMSLAELVGACGSEIEFEIKGGRAQQCLDQLRDLFHKGFGEEIDPQFVNR